MYKIYSHVQKTKLSEHNSKNIKNNNTKKFRFVAIFLKILH